MLANYALESSSNWILIFCCKSIPYMRLWYPIDCIEYKTFISFYLWCMLEGSVWNWMKEEYFGSLRTKLILAPPKMPKWVDPQWSNIELSLFKPPHYHQGCFELKTYKLKGVVCKTTNTQWEDLLSSMVTLLCGQLSHFFMDYRCMCPCPSSWVSPWSWVRDNTIPHAYFKKLRTTWSCQFLA